MTTSEQETQENLLRDRPFNPFRLPNSENVREILKDITNQLQNYEYYYGLRKRKRKKADQKTFEATVTAVVCDLIHRALTKPTGWLAIPLSKQVLGHKTRYGSPVMNKTLPDILERMASAEMNFLEMDKGYPDMGFVPAKQTTIIAGQRLWTRIAEYDVLLSDLKRSQSGEVIILKRIKDGYWDNGEKIDYEDTTITHDYRQEIASINWWLSEADIDFDEHYDRDDQRVDYTDRYLRRYFCNSSFEQGGRVFGGFWQELSKQIRKDGILINGEEVVSLDYGQMAPRILYGLEGVQPTQEDAYLIPGLEDSRPGIKKVFNAALFNDRPMKRLPKDTRKLFPKRVGISQILDGLKATHAPISHHFFTEIGYHLQFLESEILVDVLLEMKDAGMVGLPVHDAVVVPVNSMSKAKEIMLQVFKDHTGIEGIVEEE